MAATDALHEANSLLHSYIDRCCGTPGNWNAFGHLGVCQQSLLWDSATYNYLEDPTTMKDLRMHTSQDALNDGYYSLDGMGNSDLGSANCLTVNESMVSFDFTTNNEHRTATTNNMRKSIHLDFSKCGHGPNDAVEESAYRTIFGALYAVIESDKCMSKAKGRICNRSRGNLCVWPSKLDHLVRWTSAIDCDVSLVNGYSASEVANSKEIDKKGLEDEEAPGAQNNNIAKILNFDSSVGSAQVDGLILPLFKFPLAWQNTDWMEDSLSKPEEQRGKDGLREFLSLYLSAVSTIGGVIGYVAGIADIPDAVDAAANLGFVVAVGNAGLEIYSTLEDPRNSRLGYLARSCWKIWSMIRDGKNAMEDEGSDSVKLGDGVRLGMDMIEKRNRWMPATIAKIF